MKLPLDWITTHKGIPYFFTESGESWTPIGQNDAIIWPELEGLFRRKSVPQVEYYFSSLSKSGVTCLRLMLEYCQTEGRYIEKPAGKFQKNMVQLWDDIFELCEKYHLRVLLTPFDTFWMRRRWRNHPYNKINGGTCTRSSHWFLCKNTWPVMEDRLNFVIERWGYRGTLFAWDLWNEIAPTHSQNSLAILSGYIDTMSSFIRKSEIALYGKSHLQTVSAYSPHLNKFEGLREIIFRSPHLDFATTHFYDPEVLNHPKNTVDPAVQAGCLVKDALAEISDSRPFFDSEHGPINVYKQKRSLKESFDDEYFRYFQWAHFASGGAGGGMRWPYRQPHCLTSGMRTAQKSLAYFVNYLDWANFNRKNLSQEVQISRSSCTVFSCGDANQVIIWVLDRDQSLKKITTKALESLKINLKIPGLSNGLYAVIGWDTLAGKEVFRFDTSALEERNLEIEALLPASDIAIAVRKTAI